MIFLVLLCIFLMTGCQTSGVMDGSHPAAGCRYASYFSILTSTEDSLYVRGVVAISPSDGTTDTLMLHAPLSKIVCMSSSSVSALSAVGADSVIVGVSGLDYLSDQEVLARSELGEVCDLGYGDSFDFETLVRLSPDLVVAYTVGESDPPFLAKIRRLGLPVLVIYDHLETHPLARAEYVRLFGALTGRLSEADAFFRNVCDAYLALCAEDEDGDPVRVLMNIPYSDSWYIPGRESYMSRLVRDAGGLVMGAENGSASRVITIEEAYRLSQKADMWLCPGYCRTMDQLISQHHLFPHFGPVEKGYPVYNNIRKMNAGGGNDFWESGALRPDLILQDLRKIFSPSASADRLELNYFIRLQ